MVAFIDFADVKGSLISDLFLLWLHPSKNMPNFLYQGGEGQDSDLAHFFRMEKLSKIKPLLTDADAVMMAS